MTEYNTHTYARTYARMYATRTYSATKIKMTLISALLPAGKSTNFDTAVEDYLNVFCAANFVTFSVYY